jgi:hypothetical protein
MTLDAPAAGPREPERRLPRPPGLQAPERRSPGPPGLQDPERRSPGPPIGRVAQRAGVGAALSTAPVWVGRGRDEPLGGQ